MRSIFACIAPTQYTPTNSARLLMSNTTESNNGSLATACEHVWAPDGSVALLQYLLRSIENAKLGTLCQGSG
ncbi:hypothetical protein KL941_005316 [Ogataea angusta]|nr:hypothetical protein KL941_005316 [Ogataea angusta]